MRPHHQGLRPRSLPLVGVSVVAITALAAGWIPAWPGVIHAVALPPLDLAHDLAAILAFEQGWFWFLAGLVVSLLARSALLAWLIGELSWPSFRWALRFYLASLPLALAAATSFFAAGAILFYALFWLGVIFTLMLVLASGALPWVGSQRLRSAFGASASAGFRAGTIGAYLVLLTAVGVIADLGGGAGAVAAVPLSAALTWGTASVLRNPSLFRVPRRGAALLGGVGVVALAVVVAGGPAQPPAAPVADSSRPGSIMLMSGIDSRSGSGAILEVDPSVMGWDCDRTFYYSYAGPGDGQPQRVARCPIRHGAPYEPADTLRDTAEQIEFLEAQTAEMVSPGVLATHSQGVWLSWAAAAEGRLLQVETLVLVGPFPANPITYRLGPSAGAGTFVVDAIAGIPRPGGTTAFESDSSLGQEWLAHPSAIADTLARPLSGMRAVSVSSVFDLPLMPEGPDIEGVAGACPIPVIHPNLPYSLEFHQTVVAFSSGETLPGCPRWRTWIGPLFRHFTAPPNSGMK